MCDDDNVQGIYAWGEMMTCLRARVTDRERERGEKRKLSLSLSFSLSQMWCDDAKVTLAAAMYVACSSVHSNIPRTPPLFFFYICSCLTQEWQS